MRQRVHLLSNMGGGATVEYEASSRPLGGTQSCPGSTQQLTMGRCRGVNKTSFCLSHRVGAFCVKLVPAQRPGLVVTDASEPGAADVDLPT